MRILTASHVWTALDMKRAITKVGEALAELSGGRACVPERMHVGIPQLEGTVLYMPAVVSGLAASGIKVVSVYPPNRDLNRPIIYGVYVLLDAATGEPLALLEGAALTALRTGAVVGLATDLLARKDAAHLAVIGTGTQARAAVRAIMEVRSLRSVSLYNRTPRRAHEFAQYVKDLAALTHTEIKVAVCPDSDKALERADLVLMATTSSSPVFRPESVRPGMHVNAIGAFTPQMQEIPSEVVARATRVVVESRTSALSEAGDLIIPIEQGVFHSSRIYAELGEIFAGSRPGRQSADEITLFKSVGHAVMDVVVAKALFDQARIEDKGMEVDLLA